jgi:hypothetical protein
LGKGKGYTFLYICFSSCVVCALSTTFRNKLALSTFNIAVKVRVRVRLRLAVRVWVRVRVRVRPQIF